MDNWWTTSKIKLSTRYAQVAYRYSDWLSDKKYDVSVCFNKDFYSYTQDFGPLIIIII